MKKNIILSFIIANIITINANAIDPVSAIVVGSSVVGAGASVYTASKTNNANKKINSIVATQNRKDNSGTAIKCFVPANYFCCYETEGDTKCYTDTACDKPLGKVLLVAQYRSSIKYPVITEIDETLKYHKCVLI
jgi:hypothetical protein